MAVLHFFSSKFLSIIFYSLCICKLVHQIESVKLFCKNTCSKSWPNLNTFSNFSGFLFIEKRVLKKRFPNIFSVFFVLFGWYRKFPWGHMRSRTNFGPDRFSRVCLSVRLLDTNGQTDKVYIYQILQMVALYRICTLW